MPFVVVRRCSAALPHSVESGAFDLNDSPVRNPIAGCPCCVWDAHVVRSAAVWPVCRRSGRSISWLHLALRASVPPGAGLLELARQCVE